MNIRQTTLAAALALAFIGPAHAEGLKPSAGSDRHGFESRRGRMGCVSEGQHSARPLRIC